MAISDLPPDTLRPLFEALLAEGMSLYAITPVMPAMSWAIYLSRGGQLSVGRSPNPLTALMVAEGGIERREAEHTRDSSVKVETPDGSEIVAQAAE